MNHQRELTVAKLILAEAIHTLSLAQKTAGAPQKALLESATRSIDRAKEKIERIAA